ncbi:MAG: hypothetical protein QOE45_607 [Frankiaceae bacterium]|jgi:hypothetical protein|nr:hypothetical protein [Frankiaceae bacterium]
MNLRKGPRTLAAVASALFLLAGSPARADVNVDTAAPDWIVDSTDSVACTSGSSCALKIQSWTTAWGCYTETVNGVPLNYTNCQVFASGAVTATKVPNGPCAFTMINSLQISFISGINSSVGGTWHQAATFVAVENSSVGTTKYHVTMHGGGGYESESIGAGALHGEFDLTFPAPGVLRSNCKSAAAGKLMPTLNDTSDRTDGTVIHLTADSVQQ